MSWRVATVDIGSNTLKFAVTEIDEAGNESILDSHAETVRLGAGIAATGQIDPVRRDRALHAMQSYETVGLSFGAEAFVGVATAALRMASNGEELLDEIGKTTGWKIRVISGADEARLTFDGLTGYLPESGEAFLVDVGGASTELVLVRDRAFLSAESIMLGSGTLSDRCFQSDPPGRKSVNRANELARESLCSSPVMKLAAGAPLFLSGGNGQFLSELTMWSEIALSFTPVAFPQMLGKISWIESARVAGFLEIAQERARMLPAGAAIALAVIQLTSPATMQAVPSGIRGGVIADWLASR